jgi:anti-sigma factor RsiW
MTDKAEQLSEDDVQLMLHLAGELPAEPTQRLRQRLAVEPALRSRLEAMQQQQQRVFAEIDTLDRGEPLLPRGASVRRATRLMQQWNAERLAREAALAEAARRRAPQNRWWMYPAGVAAAILVGMIVWWGNTNSDQLGQPIANSAVLRNPDGSGFPPTPRISGVPMDNAFASSLTDDRLDQLDAEIDSLVYLRESIR